MQAKKTRIIKRIVDVSMTVLLLFLMAYQVTGEKLHEWIGIGMTAVLILHHILNLKWYASLFRGKYNAYRTVTVVINTLLLVSITLTALCGMAMSAYAVPFMYGMLPVTFARRFHLVMSFWSFVLMGVHLGLHVPAMTAGMFRNGKAKWIAAAAAALVTGLGFWCFFRNRISDYLFFRTPFAFFDYEKAAVVVFLENLSILTAFAFLGACCPVTIRALGKHDDRAMTGIAALVIGAAVVVLVLSLII
ncbi:MAG: DUF4405 domain-containing protein [Clostridia bacterium]|nr:DUF4405 domain-containing protein [Clostridia bacterium]